MSKESDINVRLLLMGKLTEEIKVHEDNIAYELARVEGLKAWIAKLSDEINRLREPTDCVHAVAGIGL